MSNEKDYINTMQYLLEIGFIPMHNKNLLGAEFKIGEKVKIKIDSQIGEIVAVNRIDINDFEYALKDFPFLYYEEELEKIK